MLTLLDQVGIVVQFPTMFETPGPGKYAGNGVSACRPSLEE